MRHGEMRFLTGKFGHFSTITAKIAYTPPPFEFKDYFKETLHFASSGINYVPCQRTISTQKFKLLGEVPRYDLYYSLTHPLK